MVAYLIVRAEVDQSVRDKFDVWYQNEHLFQIIQQLLLQSLYLKREDDAAQIESLENAENS